MWTSEQRQAADRTGLHYPSDLTDAEWAIVEPMIPPAESGGRRRTVNVREVLDRIFYILWTGCQWKALAKDLPPKSTVHDYLELWNWTAPWSASITSCTSRLATRKVGKRARQWRSSTRKPPRAPKKGAFARAFGLRRGQEDQGSQTAYPGRHAGLLVERRRSSDRRAGPRRCFPFAAPNSLTVRLFPFIERIFADGGYAGRKMALTVWRTSAWRMQIVKRSNAAECGVRRPAQTVRWIVERTFPWINRNRRLARDFERYATTVIAFVRDAEAFEPNCSPTRPRRGADAPRSPAFGANPRDDRRYRPAWDCSQGDDILRRRDRGVSELHGCRSAVGGGWRSALPCEPAHRAYHPRPGAHGRASGCGRRSEP